MRSFRIYLTALALILPVARCAAEELPFDAIQRCFAPYAATNDPLAMPVKVLSLTADPYKFWRGSRELFFIWCNTHCNDWLKDTDAVMPCHGDPHVGNIGTYPAAGRFGTLAFGMVDFDDSHRLPFQYELLQGVITFRLIALQNGVTLSDTDIDGIIGRMLAAYAAAAQSNQSATELLADVKPVRKLLKQNVPYTNMIAEYTDAGRFRGVINGKDSAPKEILRPAADRADAIAGVIAAAIERAPDAAKVFRYHDASTIRSHIKDIVQRTRLGSSGSQGLKKYLVLLDRPLQAIDGDAIIYLKQEAPSAVERTGVAARDPRDPAERYVADMAVLTDPPAYFSSWGAADGESYWVSIKEPWSDEINYQDVKDIAGLDHLAHIWATVTGATHRGKGALIASRITPDLAAELKLKSPAYFDHIQKDFHDFTADARVIEQVKAARKSIEVLAKTSDRP